MGAVKRWIAVHRKLVVFVVGAILTGAIHKWGTSNDWVSLGIAIATGAGVYGAPNQPAQPGRAEKTLAPPGGGRPPPLNLT